jgi:protein ImuB
MARPACVNLPALPLQLLLNRHPDWRGRPVVVVAEEKAQGRILWANGAAWKYRIRPGMRYAAALSLAGDLRGGVVPDAEIAAGVAALTERLHRFSPHVEPAAAEPGVFWLDGAGLGLLHRSPFSWAERIRAALGRAGFHATVVAGFNRFAVHAVAKARQGTLVFADPRAERRMAERVPLERLEIVPDLRDALHQLGIRTVADLLRLPATGLLPRFGRPAYRLHRLAAGLLAEPLQPVPERPPIREVVALEYPESDAARLLTLIAPPLRVVLAALAARREALAALELCLRLEGAPPLTTGVTPAAPTRDPALLLELARLRLEGLSLAGGVVGIELGAAGTARELEQLSLFGEGSGRDLRAGARALARLRAEFGEGVAVRAVLREGHLPEARFAWEPLAGLCLPRPAPEKPRTLVRRLFRKPLPLAGGTEGAPRMPRGEAPAALRGPYTVSGGWWAGALHRDYYFAELPGGDLLWIYRDRKRGRWFLQGRVE